jgi:hypothetical protein
MGKRDIRHSLAVTPDKFNIPDHLFPTKWRRQWKQIRKQIHQWNFQTIGLLWNWNSVSSFGGHHPSTSIKSASNAAIAVQALASPAYLHYLATSTTSEGQSLLLCPRFKAFLRYLHKTWSQPEYSRYITYPHSLYFLELLIKNDAFCRELAQVSFRNFCHQQQYYAWQNRFVTLYGGGEHKPEPAVTEPANAPAAEAPQS